MLLILLPVFVLTLSSALLKSFGLIILAGIIFSTFICFIDIPLGQRNGVFTYHSSLLFTSKEQDGIIEIHGGTLFDYFFTLNTAQSKRERKKIIICTYLDGLLNLIDYCEAGGKQDLRLKATSYVLNERTAARVGFTKSKQDYFQALTVTLNILPILGAYFYTNSGSGFPNIFRVQTFEASVQDVINRKENIRRLKESFQRKVITKSSPTCLP